MFSLLFALYNCQFIYHFVYIVVDWRGLVLNGCDILSHLLVFVICNLLCILHSCLYISAILSDDLWDEYFICYYVCCLPKHVMDDWKLKTTTVVRIERPNKTFVYFSVCLSVCHIYSTDLLKTWHMPYFYDSSLTVMYRIINMGIRIPNHGFYISPPHTVTWSRACTVHKLTWSISIQPKCCYCDASRFSKTTKRVNIIGTMKVFPMTLQQIPEGRKQLYARSSADAERPRKSLCHSRSFEITLLSRACGSRY